MPFTTLSLAFNHVEQVHPTMQECLLHPFVATGIDRVMLVKLLRRLGMRPCLHLATYLLTWLNLFLGEPNSLSAIAETRMQDIAQQDIAQ